MKKFILSAAFLVGMTVASQAAYTCNSNSNIINVRSGPSALDFPVVDQLDNYYNVRILGRTYNAAGYPWVRVQYNSLRYGNNRPTVEDGWVDAGSICNW